MFFRSFVTVGLAGLIGLAVWAAESGSTGAIQSKIGDRTVRMALTGSAVRTKRIFRVYNINSYLDESHAVRTPEELANADVAKQLNLVMLRNVEGSEMADAFLTAIRANYPAPAFEAELTKLTGLMRARAPKKGDAIWLTHVPGTGFQYQVVGENAHLIPNVDFSRAVWNIYFGKNNLGEQIKRGLTARLQSN